MPETDGKVAVLVSGGVDSAVLVAHLARSYRVVQPIYVRFGLAWETVEELHLRKYLDTLTSPALRPLVALEFPMGDVYGVHWSVSGEQVPDDATPDEAVYLPGRNLLLLSKPAVWCALNGYAAIALGVLKGNPFPDSDPAFYEALEAAVIQGLSSPIRFITPFAAMTKREVISLGRGLALDLSFSCIAPEDGLHCGRCNKCAERRKGFNELDTPDPTHYAASPGSGEPPEIS
jgi:7-cyano-7-deazaguanine synthase